MTEGKQLFSSVLPKPCRLV